MSPWYTAHTRNIFFQRGEETHPNTNVVATTWLSMYLRGRWVSMYLAVRHEIVPNHTQSFVSWLTAIDTVNLMAPRVAKSKSSGEIGSVRTRCDVSRFESSTHSWSNHLSLSRRVTWTPQRLCFNCVCFLDTTPWSSCHRVVVLMCARR